jgi:hypothetical protein
MSFSEDNVANAVNHLRSFAEDRGLGTPSKVLFMDERFMSGVGAEWPGEIWNAVVFHGETRSDDAAEAKRRLREWKS